MCFGAPAGVWQARCRVKRGQNFAGQGPAKSAVIFLEKVLRVVCHGSLTSRFREALSSLSARP